MMRIQLYLILVLTIFIGCSKDAVDTALENTNIESEFLPYVQSFLNEAQDRNLRISFRFTGLTVKFGIVKESEDAIGYCNEAEFEIKIDRTAWDNLSENHREVLIFHELGHCKMKRAHRTDILPNGEVTSIMWPGIKGKFFGVRRKYYIDELFSPNTIRPAWVFKSEQYSIPASKTSIIEKSFTKRILENIEFDDSRDFEIEFELTNLEEGRVGIAWGADELDKAIFVTSRASRQFDIETGIKNFGRVYSEKFLTISNVESNKITIRKIDEEYQFFLNEEYIFWMEYLPFENSFFQSFVATDKGEVNNDVDLEIRNFNISYLD